MSTRRARIKAVTSLPVRRKNTENGENLKNKQLVKECVNKTPKSPRTPRRVLQSRDVDKKSPSIKIASPVTTLNEAASVITAPIEDQFPYEVKISLGSPNVKTSPQSAAKVSVITPNLNYKPNTSNPSSSSPHARNFASPLIPSPKVVSKPLGVIVQRPVTPIKGRTPAAHTVDVNNELHITSVNVNSVNYNCVSSKSAVSDDYNVPSIPESVENDGVMDGIVPLQPERNVPKPIDLLKNEIISENAEVLFDPIIPLPSPSKVRPKLRPTPRLGPHRRSSIQGSASESEDENRRAHLSGAATPGLGRQRRDSHTSFSTLNSVPNRDTNRTRNDSVCSSASQLGGVPTASSPVKEKSSTKNRRREVSRRLATMRRRQETIKRETLTMYDLIFYNPTTNPIIPNQDEVKAKEDSIKDEMERRKEEQKKEEKMKEETLVEVPVIDTAPVPQIKLGPNGEIILDKTSLVINQTDANRDVSSVVREGSWGGGNGKYTRAPRTADWTACETVRFYRALAAIGTDFSLMAPLFPDRTRRELKLKFKKEERINGAQVDKALRMGNSWDPNRLKEEFDDEREAAARKAKRQAETLKAERLKEKERIKTSREVRVRNSRAAKALQSTMLPGLHKARQGDLDTVDDIVNRALQMKSNSVDDPVETPVAPTEVPSTDSMATLTLINNGPKTNSEINVHVDNMATITRVSNPVNTQPQNLNGMPNVPSNIETGSLVVLTVNDPSSPSKKMLQTYIAHSAGRLTPVSLPPTLLNSVVGYMKKGTPKSTMSANSSPLLTSPNSVFSHDSRASVTTPVSNLNVSPVKRQQMSTYTITQL